MASTKKRMLEIKSFADESSYNLILSGHSATLLYVAHLVPIRNDLDRIIQTAREGYMPTQFYDDAGSSVRMFSNDYARIMHMTKRSKSEEIEVFSREQISDLLLNDGWEMVGFSSHQGSIPTGMAVVERWVKEL